VCWLPAGQNRTELSFTHHSEGRWEMDRRTIPASFAAWKIFPSTSMLTAEVHSSNSAYTGLRGKQNHSKVVALRKSRSPWFSSTEIYAGMLFFSFTHLSLRQDKIIYTLSWSKKNCYISKHTWHVSWFSIAVWSHKNAFSRQGFDAML